VHQSTDIVPQMRKNIDHWARFLRLGNFCRTGIPGYSVIPTCPIQKGLILSERVSDSIYALTWRNRIVTAFFVTLTTVQAILGVVFLASPDNTGKTSGPTPFVYRDLNDRILTFFLASYSDEASRNQARSILHLLFRFKHQARIGLHVIIAGV